VVSVWIESTTSSAGDAKARRTQLDLGGGLLAARVKHPGRATGGARERAAERQEKRRLADTRLAPQQHQRACDETSAEDAVYLSYADRDSICVSAVEHAERRQSWRSH
jgi:hypothetical protein